ncbi:MAG: hypothetical protein IJK81_05625 [Selenomonadaceae bacterium]|nr:hypothetical protein [Selenomonadaceae bacterium]
MILHAENIIVPKIFNALYKLCHRTNKKFRQTDLRQSFFRGFDIINDNRGIFKFGIQGGKLFRQIFRRRYK